MVGSNWSLWGGVTCLQSHISLTSSMYYSTTHPPQSCKQLGNYVCWGRCVGGAGGGGFLERKIIIIQGNLKKELIVATILTSHIEVSYCTCRKSEDTVTRLPT